MSRYLAKIKKVLNAILNRTIYKMKWHNEYWGDTTKFWNLSNFNLDVVNLGSNSSRFAFSYIDSNLNCMNWAVSPQYLKYDFELLKNYHSFLAEGATVYISLCPFSFFYPNFPKSYNLKYYTFLNPVSIIDFDEEERIKALQLKYNFIEKKPLYTIKETLKALIKAFLSFLYNNKQPDYSSFNMVASQMMYSWKKQFSINNFEEPLSEQLHDELVDTADTLNNMLQFCKERGFKPIVVIPPIHKSLSSLLPVWWNDALNDFIRLSNLQETPFYNFASDSRFMDDSFYRTPLYLNKEGARFFTNTLLKITTS